MKPLPARTITAMPHCVMRRRRMKIRGTITVMITRTRRAMTTTPLLTRTPIRTRITAALINTTTAPTTDRCCW